MADVLSHISSQRIKDSETELPILAMNFLGKSTSVAEKIMKLKIETPKGTECQVLQKLISNG